MNERLAKRVGGARIWISFSFWAKYDGQYHQNQEGPGLGMHSDSVSDELCVQAESGTDIALSEYNLGNSKLHYLFS